MTKVEALLRTASVALTFMLIPLAWASRGALIAFVIAAVAVNAAAFVLELRRRRR